MENTHPWIEPTRWPQIYEELRRDLLQNMTDIIYATAGVEDPLLTRLDGEDPIVNPAKRDERSLRLVMLAMDCVLDRCEETVHQTCRFILCWLVTTHPAPCYNRPFPFNALERGRQERSRLAMVPLLGCP